VVALSDSDGDAVQSYEYSAYGRVAGGLPGRIDGYLGQQGCFRSLLGRSSLANELDGISSGSLLRLFLGTA